MIKLKGRLLNLNSTDVCGRKWSKNCKISFPDKVPVFYNFKHNIPPCGSAKISKDKYGLECEVELSGEIPIENAYVGGYYNNIESHSESSVTVIDSCKLISMSIVPDDQVADRNLKIRRSER